MSTNCAPHLSQLVHVATPNPIEAEKASLREKFVATSTALVAEAKCLLGDKEELWEEKVMWMRRWEQRTGEVFPLIEHRRALGINTKIDMADGPTVAEADEAYERWVSEEITQGRADEDVRMEEEASQVVKEQGASLVAPMVMEKMLHIEVVSRLVRKQSQQTIAESEDEDKPKIVIPPSSILHKVQSGTRAMAAQMKQGCEKSMKAAGKKVQAGASVTWSSKAVKAGPSKRATDNDNDNDEVEVVESHTCAKGKALVCGWLDPKVMANLSQSLRLLHVEAAELHAAYLRLQVHVDQPAEALEKIGVE
ncbi:hypothetical protein M404DRAFT_26239 [Pisolithus tinctorius Marx 270]|uniref:Uncharacterized protein n=1 Tax=Pisolithus tinctorius Marx 270 TaxID=870435 RepID=A0A0C3J5Q3_PISTI|nr:hypothetical protein M404DRAFT_26239 [Pisolithus tinctorius Marx 270]